MLMQTLQLWKLLCYLGSICGWMACGHYCSICSICSWFLSPMAWICFELSQRSFALWSISKDFHGSLNCLNQLPTPCTNAACNQLARHVIIMLAGYACYCTLDSECDFGCTRAFIYVLTTVFVYTYMIFIHIYIHIDIYSRYIHYYSGRFTSYILMCNHVLQRPSCYSQGISEGLLVLRLAVISLVAMEVGKL